MSWCRMKVRIIKHVRKIGRPKYRSSTVLFTITAELAATAVDVTSDDPRDLLVPEKSTDYVTPTEDLWVYI